MTRREREFTPEEAYALTMRETTPHWYGSTPLVVGVNLHEGAYPQPLDPVMNTGNWVFFFASATGAEFPRVLEVFKSWIKRFQPLGVKFVLAFRGHYSYFNERKVMEAWIKSFDYSVPFVCDISGSLAKSFGAVGEPAVAILSEGKILFSDSGPQWTENAEARLQILLRESAPGLPLWPVLREDGSLQKTTDRWPLAEGTKAITTKQVVLVGRWELDENRIVTSDSKAELHFTAPAPGVFIIARSLSDAGDPTRIRFDTDGASFADLYAGKDMAVDDEGNSSLMLAGPRAYSALKNLPPLLRKLRFRFPFAKVSPVAVYGLEFGEPSV